MILASLLGALSIFFVLILVWKALGPSGTFGKKKRMEKRIFGGADISDDSAGTNSSIEKKSQLSAIGTVESLLKRYHLSEEVGVNLQRTGFKISVSVFYLSCAVLSLLSFLILSLYLSGIQLVLAAIAIGVSPFFYIRWKNKQYLWKFMEVLPDALSIVSNSIKVGQSLETAIAAVTRSSLHPVSTEFKKVLAQVKLGQPLPAAFNSHYPNLKIPEFKIFITGVSIQQELGGNLAEILQTLEKTIRDRFALQREIKALSSQGILSTWVLLAIPFVVATIWLMSDPEMLLSWVNTPSGRFGLIYCVFSTIIAFFWMRRICNIRE